MGVRSVTVDTLVVMAARFVFVFVFLPLLSRVSTIDDDDEGASPLSMEKELECVPTHFSESQTASPIDCRNETSIHFSGSLCCLGYRKLEL